MVDGTQIEPATQRFVESESATTNHEQNHAGSAPVVITLAIVGCLMLLMFAFTSLVGAAMQSQLGYSLMSPYGSSLDFDDKLLEIWEDDFGYDDYGFDPYGFEDDWWSSSAELRSL